jgi:hypothetical protein
MTHSLWKLKNRVMDSLRKEGLWIVSHNGPIEVVETTQIGFFAGLHPELYQRGYQDNINRRIAVHFNTNKATLIMRAHEIPELKDFLGPMPQAQVIPITIPGMSTDGGKSQKVLSMGVSVPSKFRALFKYILYSISNDMGIEYVDFSMKYDKQRKILYNKLVRSHQEFMHHHKTINIHCMERDEMHTCMNELMAINSVIAIDETVITERNGTWVLVLQYNDQTGFEQTDLDTIDRIIATNPPMIDRKLHHQPFRKRDPIERLDLEALSLQEKKYKNFTATPFNTTNSWSSKLFPPKNIITQRGDGRSNKTAVSITDEDTVATLTDTVNNLQQSIERLATELRQTNRTMTTIDSRLITEETRGQQQSTAIGYLEQSQLLTTETMSRQMEQARAEARDSRDEARAEALVNMDKLDKSMEQAREEAKKDRELAKKDREAAAEKAAASAHAMESMISQLLKHNSTPSTPLISRQTNITNNNTAQAVTNNGDIVLYPNQSHEKRKQVDKTPSVTPDEQEIASPTRRKQRSERSIPAVINFDNYTEETSNQFTNGHMQATADTEMTNHDEESSVLSGAVGGNGNIGYVQSVGSQDLQSGSSDEMIEEEEQTITEHDFTNTIEEIDYTPTNVGGGFLPVRGGSPNRTPVGQRQQARYAQFHNQFSALATTNNDTTTPPTTNNIANGTFDPERTLTNNNNKTTSAKTDQIGENE